jgi:hypothetical protein
MDGPEAHDVSDAHSSIFKAHYLLLQEMSARVERGQVHVERSRETLRRSDAALNQHKHITA